MNTLETDYLVIGSGAMGMAFTDTLLTETDADIVIIDKHHKPGGHWNDAYPFVTLHQPSSYYGVSSKELSKGRKDEMGLNKGLNDLATGPEIMGYFEDVMRHTFLPSGRVRYFPMCEYNQDGTFTSLVSGARQHIRVRKKTVDATHLKTTVPSTHVPGFEIASGAHLKPLNELPQVSGKYSRYVVIGGGKTGIDAVLWLLENQMDPKAIRWIMPRDAWLLDRRHTQPTDEFFTDTMGAQAAQMEAVAEAVSTDDLFDRLEAAGVFVRIDTGVRPKMFHGATISQAELQQLRRVKNIVRMGRVQRIETDRIVLDGGVIPTGPDCLHVDCSARAVGNMDVVPVFAGATIRLQTVRTVQPVFSSAFIAYIEATRDSEDEKNRLCQVVPLPDHDTDWLKLHAVFMMNQYNWSQEKDVRQWLLHNRLDGYSQMARNVAKDDADKQAILERLRANAAPAMANLHKLLAGAC